MDEEQQLKEIIGRAIREMADRVARGVLTGIVIGGLLQRPLTDLEMKVFVKREVEKDETETKIS